MAGQIPRPGSAKLGAKLIELRQGLTQEQAAVKAGISLGTWQNIERAKSGGFPSTLRKIEQAFGLKERELASYRDDRPLVDRYTDAELLRLAKRLAPLIAQELRHQKD